MSERTKRIALIAGGLVALVVFGLIGAFVGSEATERRAAELEATPAGTPVETIVDCPWGEASCVLALGIERALQSGNVSAVMDFAEPRFYICPGRTPTGAGGPYPLCDDKASDTGLEGFPVARRYSEGRVVDEPALRNMLVDFVGRVDPEASDDLGDGRLRLYAFGCPQRAIPFQNVSCARLAIILSAIVGRGADAHRELLIFWAVGQFDGRTLPVTEVWDGIVLETEKAVIFHTGGVLPDLGEIYPIDQALRGEPGRD